MLRETRLLIRCGRLLLERSMDARGGRNKRPLCRSPLAGSLHLSERKALLPCTVGADSKLFSDWGFDSTAIGFDTWRWFIDNHTATNRSAHIVVDIVQDALALIDGVLLSEEQRTPHKRVVCGLSPAKTNAVMPWGTVVSSLKFWRYVCNQMPKLLAALEKHIDVADFTPTYQVRDFTTYHPGCALRPMGHSLCPGEKALMFGCGFTYSISLNLFVPTAANDLDHILPRGDQWFIKTLTVYKPVALKRIALARSRRIPPLRRYSYAPSRALRTLCLSVVPAPVAALDCSSAASLRRPG